LVGHRTSSYSIFKNGEVMSRPPEQEPGGFTRRSALAGIGGTLTALATPAAAQRRPPNSLFFRPGPPTEPLARRQHASVVLPSGLVMVIGGWHRGPLAHCQMYDAAADRWHQAPSLPVPLYRHTATLVYDHLILVLGGFYHGPMAVAYRFDLLRQRWEPARPLQRPRYDHQAALLPSQEVVVTGGFYHDDFAQPERYRL
jgi:hypothetical protein